MELELVKLIFNYTKQGKVVDKYFLNKLVEIVVDSKKLHNYVKGINFVDNTKKNDGSFPVASYLPYYNVINVYFQNILKYLRSIKVKYSFSDFENLFLRNLIIVQFILHEIEHANQQEKIDIGKNYEACLLREVMKDSNTKTIYTSISNGSNPDILLQKLLAMKKLYNTNYKYAPHERLAEIVSYREIVNILNLIKKNVPNLFDFENYKLLTQLLRGYEKSDDARLISPTIHYLTSGRMISSLKKLDLLYDEHTLLSKTQNRFDLSSRLILGLPIDEFEYSELSKQLNLINKYE